MEVRIQSETADNKSARRVIVDLDRHIKRYFSKHDGELETRFEKVSTDTQDLGSILTIVLGAPAIVVLANAVRDWVQHNSGSTITINGVTIKNVRSEDIAEVIRAIKDTGE